MKRVVKAFGVLAAIGAAVWLMRDRLVTLTVGREPEPPTFRVPPPPDDLTEIKGVGPAYAEKLRAGGVRTFSDLAAVGPLRLSELAGVSEERAQDWIAQAADRS